MPLLFKPVSVSVRACKCFAKNAYHVPEEEEVALEGTHRRGCIASTASALSKLSRVERFCSKHLVLQSVLVFTEFPTEHVEGHDTSSQWGVAAMAKPCRSSGYANRCQTAKEFENSTSGFVACVGLCHCFVKKNAQRT